MLNIKDYLFEGTDISILSIRKNKRSYIVLFSGEVAYSAHLVNKDFNIDAFLGKENLFVDIGDGELSPYNSSICQGLIVIEASVKKIIPILSALEQFQRVYKMPSINRSYWKGHEEAFNNSLMKFKDYKIKNFLNFDENIINSID